MEAEYSEGVKHWCKPLSVHGPQTGATEKSETLSWDMKDEFVFSKYMGLWWTY